MKRIMKIFMLVLALGCFTLQSFPVYAQSQTECEQAAIQWYAQNAGAYTALGAGTGAVSGLFLGPGVLAAATVGAVIGGVEGLKENWKEFKAKFKACAQV